AGAVGEAEQRDARSDAAFGAGHVADALRLSQTRADRLVGALRTEYLVCKAGAPEPAEVPVRFRMAADLEQRIRHELSCALLVRAQPFAAGEERGLDVLLAQVVDDSAVVACNLAWLLAQVERERDQLAPA